MQTMVDALGMIMLILLGVIVILGMVIVIAAECRVINRLRVREPLPLEPLHPLLTGPFPAVPHGNGRSQGTLDRDG